MNEHNTVESAPKSLQRSDVKRFILKRVMVMSLMVYLAVMVSVADSGIIGDMFGNFYWRSSGWSLFPIPLNPNWFGWIVYFMIMQLSPLELLVYLIFVGHGVWVFWEIIGVVYIVYPWSPFLRSIITSGRTIIATRIGRGS